MAFRGRNGKVVVNFRERIHVLNVDTVFVTVDVEGLRKALMFFVSAD